MDKDLKYKIGITLIPSVGHVTAKTLIAYCGSVEAVFNEKEKNLLKIPDIGEITADYISNQNVLERAEREIEFIEKNNITPLFYLDKEYPLRLKQCEDGPVMLLLQRHCRFECITYSFCGGKPNGNSLRKENV